MLNLCDPCRLRLMRRLGMPVDLTWCHVRVWVDGPGRSLREVAFPSGESRAETYGISQPITPAAAKRWARYEATLFGRGLDPRAPVTGDPGRLWPCHIPGLGRITVQLWRMTARYDRSPIRAEWRWHPEDGPETTIGGPVDAPHCQDEVERARQGFALLLSLKDEGGRHRLEDDPESGWLDITRRALALKAERPSREWKGIARTIGVSVSTLRDYRRRYKQLGPE